MPDNRELSDRLNLTQSQEQMLRRAERNGGSWWPEGSGEWTTARWLVARDLARHDPMRHGRFLLNEDGRRASRGLDEEEQG